MYSPIRPGQTLAGALVALAGFAVFALHDAIIKYLGGQYSPVQLVFLAALVGIGPLSLALRRAGGITLAAGPARMLVRLRSIAVVGATLAAFHAFASLPLAQAYAILFATPLLIGLLAVPILRERLAPIRLAAILVGLVGVLIVLQPGQEPLQAGHLSALISALCGALVAVLTRRIGRNAPLGLILLQPMVANLAIMGLALPFVFRPMPPEHVSLVVLLGLCAVSAMALSIKALRMAPAAIVAPMQYSQAVWALIYGRLLFDEHVTATTLVGASLVIASGAFIVLREAMAARMSRPHAADVTPG